MNADTNNKTAYHAQIQKELHTRLFPSLYGEEAKLKSYYDSLPPDAHRNDDNREITNYEDIRGR